MTIFAAIFLLAQAVVPVQGAAGDPFWPKKSPKSEVSVRLDVKSNNNMPLVSAELNGVACTLLLDTGATHTTFNMDFVRNAFPDAVLTPVMLMGDSNVASAPSFFNVESLKLGDAEFSGFGAMALGLAHLHAGIGERVDGVIGMNVIGRVPSLISLCGGEIVFCPRQERLEGLGESVARLAEDPMSIAFKAAVNEREFILIVDSGSSMTFLSRETSWPVVGEASSMSAVDVNGKASLAPRRGAAGSIALGMPVEISPLVVDERINCIGSDTLRKYDMMINGMSVRFRRAGASTGE